VILAERREVLAAVPAACPEHDQALDELRGRQPALPLLHRHLRVDRGGDPELAEELDHERNPRPPGDQRGIKGLINLEGWRRVWHRTPPWCGYTQWVKPSKPDAIAGNRLYGGLPCNPFGRSSF